MAAPGDCVDWCRRQASARLALIWGSLDRRPRGRCGLWRHRSGPGVPSTGVYLPGPRYARVEGSQSLVGQPSSLPAPALFFSRLAMKLIYAYDVGYVRYLEAAWTIQKSAC